MMISNGQRGGKHDTPTYLVRSDSTSEVIDMNVFVTGSHCKVRITAIHGIDLVREL